MPHVKGYRPTTITKSSTPHDQMSTFCEMKWVVSRESQQAACCPPPHFPGHTMAAGGAPQPPPLPLVLTCASYVLPGCARMTSGAR